MLEEEKIWKNSLAKLVREKTKKKSQPLEKKKWNVVKEKSSKCFLKKKMKKSPQRLALEEEWNVAKRKRKVKWARIYDKPYTR